VIVAGFASREDADRVVLYARNLGVNVRFMFNLNRDQALRMLSHAKLLIYPSKIDAFPLVVLEALSCGTPVVAYALPAIRFNFETEAVVKVPPGRLDYLVDTAIDMLERHDEKRNEAINYAMQFSWERVSAVEWTTLLSLSLTI
jgi:Glycosyltransferase